MLQREPANISELEGELLKVASREGVSLMTRGNLGRLKELIYKPKNPLPAKSLDDELPPLVDQDGPSVPEDLAESIEIPPGTEMVLDETLLDAKDKANNTLLHWASGGNHIDVMVFLINSGCKLNEQNVLGDTPLHRAVWRNANDAVKLLLQSAVDHSIANAEGQQAKDLASAWDTHIVQKITVAAKLLFGSFLALNPGFAYTILRTYATLVHTKESKGDY
ncbi:osteoclast-stimulating factor 1-like [Planoprotostelium fungivorum]|uniref:Osteoclast-stimulating factor 1-like n=1 Tax=Planoprotostelium fungivorum TaxID=1890364 RepID=A0A2P6MTT2_9EUKA|nr:osteoclast-stimulating factor 1-like [Planoprotostelium fungivorum]